VVIDDMLRDPQSAVRFAAERLQFAPAQTHYPGVMAVSPNEYVMSLYKAISPVMQQTFGVNVDGPVKARSFFGIVTIPPDKLNVGQRHPHIDTPNPLQLAVLHYLCNSTHGGTAFYRHRATGFESLDGAQYMQMAQMLAANAQSKGELPAQYVTGDNDLYEQTANLDARFNRLLIYRSRVLHAGNISPTANLSPDPRVGRLTANTFLEFQS
jgi:hypothetical protein